MKFVTVQVNRDVPYVPQKLDPTLVSIVSHMRKIELLEYENSYSKLLMDPIIFLFIL